MEIIKDKNEGVLTITLSGRLDTTTSPQLEVIVDDELTGESDVVIDFENLDYMSSAGLRVLLKAAKKMAEQGTLVIRHVKPEVREVFEVTGFDSFLTIED